MSLYDYRRSQDLERADVGFHALVMAAMRRADTDNLAKLQRAWPEVWTELQARYHAPGGVLEGELATSAEPCTACREVEDQLCAYHRVTP